MVQDGNTDAPNLLLQQNWGYLNKCAQQLWDKYEKVADALPITTDDLVQEGAFGLLRSCTHYKPDAGSKFLTYATMAIRRSMLDYMHQQYDALKEQGTHMRLLLQEGTVYRKGECLYLVSRYHLSPEQIYLIKERNEAVHAALNKLNNRESTYLQYRFGFDEENQERTIADTARHFHLSRSWAKSIEKNALDNTRRELLRQE